MKAKKHYKVTVHSGSTFNRLLEPEEIREKVEAVTPAPIVIPPFAFAQDGAPAELPVYWSPAFDYPGWWPQKLSRTGKP